MNYFRLTNHEGTQPKAAAKHGMDQQCTPAQQDAIRKAADERVLYLRWLCDRLEDGDSWRAHTRLLKSLISEVRQLLGAKQ